MSLTATPDRIIMYLSQYNDMIAERDALAEQVALADRLFDLQQTRMKDATRLWQAATGNHDALPDLGELLGWLMRDRAELRAHLRQAQAQRNTAYGYGSDAGKPPWMR